MKDLLIEVGFMEMPALLMPKIRAHTEAMIIAELEDKKCQYSGCEVTIAPQRIVIFIRDLQAETATAVIERQGPKCDMAFDASGQPLPAALGFARSCGVAVEDLQREQGRLVYSGSQPGQCVKSVLPEVITTAMSKPLPMRTMRWGTGTVSYIRPLLWLAVLYGDEVIPVTLWGVDSGSISYGHRALGSPQVKISAANYTATMEKHQVMHDQHQRQQCIEQALQDMEHPVAADPQLLVEVVNLVEWPVLLIGTIADKFMSLPTCLLRTVLAYHQKSFLVCDADGQALPHFAFVTNAATYDHASVIAGNEKVVTARLEDAAFFYDQDRALDAAHYREKLRTVTFIEGLGSVADKIDRLHQVAKAMVPYLSIDQSVHEAIDHCKLDLASQSVAEFPTLEGAIGEKLCQHWQVAEDIAVAVHDHVLPRHASDDLPTTLLGRYVALFDKMDTLCALFTSGLQPTGEKDPYGARRLALGCARILSTLPLALSTLIEVQLATLSAETDLKEPIHDFIMTRMQAWWHEQGIDRDFIAAVSGLRGHFQQIQKTLDTLTTCQTEDLIQVVNTHKRLYQILRKHESMTVHFDVEVADQPIEQMLYLQLQAMPARHDTEYFKSLTTLASTLQQFFAEVMVMDPDPQKRQNRVYSVQQSLQHFDAYADFSALYDRISRLT